MRAIKQRVVVCAETMQTTKQHAKVDPLMQEIHMQATKQIADVAYEVVFPEPDWIEMCMQCSYCSLLQPNTPLAVSHLVDGFHVISCVHSLQMQITGALIGLNQGRLV